MGSGRESITKKSRDIYGELYGHLSLFMTCELVEGVVSLSGLFKVVVGNYILEKQ